MTIAPGAVPADFRRIRVDGDAAATTRAIPVEQPVAIEVDGVGYAVMMATPCDLDDFVTGFALSDRLVTNVAEIAEIVLHAVAGGTIARLFLVEGAADDGGRRRRRVSDSSCGLCGVEGIEGALQPLPAVPPSDVPMASVFAALSALRAHQHLNAATGGVHAAARCDRDGRILDVREDVGRHNAFDKLIGAMARAGVGWDGGFALLSSRCSYELVEKAARSACPMLVTVSVATSLAVARAASCGLRLVPLARADAVLEA